MTYAELTRRLLELGCLPAKQGSHHEIWINPILGQTTAIPRHYGKDIPKGTLSKIVKDLGVADHFRH